jgi:DNA repair protein RecO (recombination protein O)
LHGATHLTAYVLHSRRYRESSLIAELLTREQGRLVAMAKGVLRVRQPDTRIQPFQPLQVDLRGRGEVLTLTRAEPLSVPLQLHGRNLYCGLYLNELLLKLTARQDPHPEVFDDYSGAIRELAGDSPLEPVLRRFEVRLMSHLGLGLALENDVAGAAIEAGRQYSYECNSGAKPAVDGQSPTVSGATLLALRTGSFEDEVTLLQARRLMRRIIDYHLDGRTLHSRELFR